MREVIGTSELFELYRMVERRAEALVNVTVRGSKLRAIGQRDLYMPLADIGSRKPHQWCDLLCAADPAPFEIPRCSGPVTDNAEMLQIDRRD